jgi:photosystem II stability/assembly factor-like uncharacterized protein
MGNRKISERLNGQSKISLIDAYGTNLFATSANEVYRSMDNGAAWTKVAAFPPYHAPWGDMAITVNTLIVDGQIIIAGVTNNVSYAVTYRSTDNGSAWTEITSGLQGLQINRFSLIGSVLYAATVSHGVFTSFDHGATWNPNTIGVTKLTETVGFTSLGKRSYAATYGDGILMSVDGGHLWGSIDKSPAYCRSLVSLEDHVLLGANDGLFLSTDSGMTWKSVYDGPFNSGDPSGRALGVIGGNFFASMNHGLYKSENGGYGWSRLSLSLSSVYNPHVNWIAGRGHTLLASNGETLVRSTDDGSSWNTIENIVPSNYSMYLEGLAFNNTFAFLAASYFGMYRSSDDGVNWAGINSGFTNLLADLRLQCIALRGTDIFVGTNSGIYHSSNNGDIWELINTGLSNINIYSLFIDENTIYAGSASGIFYRPLAEVTSIPKDKSYSPQQFALSQNYPNPFNPSTTISFSIPSRSLVTLKIFDVMGREVSTVVSETMSAGNYSKVWNGSGIPSGVYFYRLQAGAFLQTRKLVMMR